MVYLSDSGGGRGGEEVGSGSTAVVTLKPLFCGDQEGKNRLDTTPRVYVTREFVQMCPFLCDSKRTLASFFTILCLQIAPDSCRPVKYFL